MAEKEGKIIVYTNAGGAKIQPGDPNIEIRKGLPPIEERKKART